MTKILLLAANPIDESLLQLNKEIREIDSEVRRAKFGAQFIFEPKVAVRLRDLSEYLEEVKPDIVHFSGHGSPSSEIVLEDDDGHSRPVSKEALRDIFSLLKGNIQCVVLNACYAEHQAYAIAEFIDFVVGMTGPIDDSAAIEFAREFYRQLAKGKDVETAFKLARALIPDGQNLARLLTIRAPSRPLFIEDTVGRPNYRLFGIIAFALLAVVAMILWFRSPFEWRSQATPTASMSISSSSVAEIEASLNKVNIVLSWGDGDQVRIYLEGDPAYKELANQCINLLQGKRMVDPVPLDLINGKYKEQKGVPPNVPIAPERYNDIENLKLAIFNTWKERYGDSVRDSFDEIVENN